MTYNSLIIIISVIYCIIVSLMQRNNLFLILLSIFSFLFIFFSDTLSSTNVNTNIYSMMQEKYQNEASASMSDWIYFLAQKYWVDDSYISNILNWKLIYCSIGNNNLLRKLGIDTWSNYNQEDYVACYEKISEKFNNYLNSKIINKELSDSLQNENLLANWKDDDGPYDLVIDVQNLSNVLFKKKIKKIPFWKVNIWKTWKSAVKQLEKEWKKALEKIWLKKKHSFSSSSVASTNSSVSLSPAALLRTSNLSKLQVSSNLSNSLSSTKVFSPNNPNLQIWNQCWTWNANSIINKLKKIDKQNNITNTLESINLENTNTIWLNNNNENISEQDNLFNKFWLWSWDKWWFIDWLFSTFSWFNWLSLKWGFTQWGWCAGQDKLLSVCFKLVPSWPRWPVGWTSFVHSIEQEIDKIWDTLKDIKQNFIIPAGHGDEALDIDFKHIKFANIMAFNIVLTSKPVFNFKEDKKTEQEANVADTECSWVPHKLAVMYSRLGIAYCLNKWLDKDKYLFTNVSTVKIPLNPSLKPIKNNNSTDGIYNEEKQYKQLLSNILWFTTSLNKLMKTWLNSSIALEAKSE